MSRTASKLSRCRNAGLGLLSACRQREIEALDCISREAVESHPSKFFGKAHTNLSSLYPKIWTESAAHITRKLCNPCSTRQISSHTPCPAILQGSCKAECRLLKMLQKSASSIIETNQDLQFSNRHHCRWKCWLASGLYAWCACCAYVAKHSQFEKCTSRFVSLEMKLRPLVLASSLV